MLRTIMENCVPIMIKYAICTPAKRKPQTKQNKKRESEKESEREKKYINENKLQCEFGKSNIIKASEIKIKETQKKRKTKK